MTFQARPVQSAIQRWEQFWFENVPSDLFAFVRIVVGAAGLVSLVGALPVAVFWSPDGLAPLPGGGFGLRSLVAQSGLGVPVGWVIFLTLLASLSCMTVGLFTGTAVVVCFLGSVFQAHWNSLPLTSGHVLLVAVLFCLVWADCGTRMSVDAWLQQRSPVTKSRGPIVSCTSEVQPIWPLRLIRIQIALVYVSSGLFKLLGAAWRDGSAIHYAIMQNVYGRIFHVYAVPANLDWLLTLLTYMTLFWEIAFPLMLLNRATRRVALLLGVAVHGGIWMVMEVGPFSWMMLASYLAFLDPHAVAHFFVRRRESETTLAPTSAAASAA